MCCVAHVVTGWLLMQLANLPGKIWKRTDVTQRHVKQHCLKNAAGALEFSLYAKSLAT